jgi:hypothetical protein
MSAKNPSTFLTLPVELIYRILDNQDATTILFSARDVCSRLNAIIDTYHRYKVTFYAICEIIFISMKDYPQSDQF